MIDDVPRILPLGEAALTIRLGEAASVEVAERSAALAGAIRAASLDNVTDVVPAIAAVTVYYDISSDGASEIASRRAARQAALRDVVAAAMRQQQPLATFETHTIPVRYDGQDLEEVAARTGLTREDVIARHSAREYRVLAIGFLPGWAYMGPLDKALSLPRRSTPRTRIPAGSVAIAGMQTGIYPRVSPGGWHLIGSTDVVLFDPGRAKPALFAPGDRVCFAPI
jgi:KipI family sensor histidine kinase inhibitor